MARTRRRRRDLVLVISIVVVIWGLFTHGTFAGSGDEPHYLIIAKSIAFDRNLDVANDYANETLIGGGTLEPGAHAQLRDGKLRPVHDVGMPFVLAPVVAVAYVGADFIGNALPSSWLARTRLTNSLIFRHLISIFMAVLTALLARELFLLLQYAGASERGAFWWSLLFALTPPVLSHSFLFFTEIPTALITMWVFRRLTASPMRSAAIAAVAGALTGLLFLIHARNIGLVAGLSLLAALQLKKQMWKPQIAGAFAAALLLGVVARTMTIHALWGSWLTTPHVRVAETSIATVARELFERTTGLLFDREHGLLPYAPIYILAAAGLVLLWRRNRVLATSIFIVAGAYLLPVLLPFTNPHGWRGGWSPAARFLVPIIALVWVGVAELGQRAGRGLRVAVAALMAVQIVLNMYLWQYPKTMWNDDDGVAALRWVSWMPSWLEPGSAVVFAGAFVSLVLMSFVAIRSFRVRQPS